MTYREILSDIRKRKFAPVYILMGEEPFYIDKVTSALEQSVVADEDREFDQTVIFGADNNIGGVLESASRFPMMAPLQLVLFKEAQSMTQAKTNLDKLAPYIERPNPNTVLVIAFKGDKLNATSSLLKAAKKNKEVVVMESPKIKDYNIGENIREYCASERISIDDKAIELLVSNVGNSLESLVSEIEKLRVVIKEPNARITSQHIQDHVGISKEFNNFQLKDALAKRDFPQAVRIVRYFENNPKATQMVQTTGTLFGFYQNLLLASFSADKSDKALMEMLKLKNTYALREIRTGLSFYNASQLVRAIRAIREFDTKSKGINSFQKEHALLLELIFTLVTL